MIETIEDLRTFARIIAAGNLSRAASSLGITLSVVSKRLMSLEARAGVKLVNRTTRRLAATDEGREFLIYAQRILDAVEEAESSLRGVRAEPNGLLKISAPSALGRRQLAAICGEMYDKYERLNIDLILTERHVDLADEHVDVAFRIGDFRDQTAIVRRLASDNAVVLASPAYLEKYGAPVVPADLDRHSCLSNSDLNLTWRMKNPTEGLREIKVSSRLRCVDEEVIVAWALAGHGLIFRSRIGVSEELRSGILARVLPEWMSESFPICATYLPDRLRAAKVVSLLDIAERRFRALEAM